MVNALSVNKGNAQIFHERHLAFADNHPSSLRMLQPLGIVYWQVNVKFSEVYERRNSESLPTG
jgi:hypothetical protein